MRYRFSTLTNIQNTESSAEFTQDGEKLVWNTDDTDVYYKGDTDRALPIQATVTYALDGQEAALEDLIGKSGHLTMTIALKNNETGTVNVNGTDRTIVSGIAKFYNPEELVGKQVCFIANFAPRKLMGIESQGMILSAENFDGSLSVTRIDREVKPGSQVG